eukprot:TRINITY_DN9040_c0_g1_i2.p1 TRINITY_DN9040_c0_g1~~TRINITY_DN9040_c0_g1_i2.p1  ORF type:complete len:211 (-),score=-16.77 TRINITY_DN9040_c0_g1_i2:188-820(-)
MQRWSRHVYYLHCTIQYTQYSSSMKYVPKLVYSKYGKILKDCFIPPVMYNTMHAGYTCKHNSLVTKTKYIQQENTCTVFYLLNSFQVVCQSGMKIDFTIANMRTRSSLKIIANGIQISTCNFIYNQKSVMTKPFFVIQHIFQNLKGQLLVDIAKRKRELFNLPNFRLCTEVLYKFSRVFSTKIEPWLIINKKVHNFESCAISGCAMSMEN